MDKTYWGTDSASSLQSIAADVHSAYGYLPSWTGRYVSEYALIPAEVAWLHGNTIAILPLYNGAVAADVAGTDGASHGSRAVAEAVALGVPKGVALPVDIETPWGPSAEFIRTYAAQVYAGGYVPAAYLNVLQQSHTAPFLDAVAALGKNIYIYSSEPELDAWRGTVKATWEDFSPWLGAHANLVAWHQYSENELNNRVDLDLCNETGWGLLWHPVPPPAPKPKLWRVVTKTDLHQDHTAQSPLAIDQNHHAVVLPVGATVQEAGEGTASWVKVTLPGTPVWGWVLRTCLR